MSEIKSNGKRKQRFRTGTFVAKQSIVSTGDKKSQSETYKSSLQSTPQLVKKSIRTSIIDSESHGIPTLLHQPVSLNMENANKKSNVWRKTNTILKGIAKNSPSKISERAQYPVQAKRRISSVNELEAELDQLLSRVAKVEENLRGQMDELLKFVKTYVEGEKPNTTEDNEKEDELDQSKKSHKDLVYFLAAKS